MTIEVHKKRNYSPMTTKPRPNTGVLKAIVALLKCQTCGKTAVSPNCCRQCGALTCGDHSAGRCPGCGNENEKIICKGFQDLAQECMTAQMSSENRAQTTTTTTTDSTIVSENHTESRQNIEQICKELLNMCRYCFFMYRTGYMSVQIPYKADVLRAMEKCLILGGCCVTINWSCNMLCILCDQKLVESSLEMVNPADYGIPVIYKPFGIPVIYKPFGPKL